MRVVIVKQFLVLLFELDSYAGSCYHSSFHVQTFDYSEQQQYFSASCDFFSGFRQMKTVQIRTFHAGLTFVSFDFGHLELTWFLVCLAY